MCYEQKIQFDFNMSVISFPYFHKHNTSFPLVAELPLAYECFVDMQIYSVYVSVSRQKLLTEFYTNN